MNAEHFEELSISDNAYFIPHHRLVRRFQGELQTAAIRQELVRMGLDPDAEHDLQVLLGDLLARAIIEDLADELAVDADVVPGVRPGHNAVYFKNAGEAEKFRRRWG